MKTSISPNDVKWPKGYLEKNLCTFKRDQLAQRWHSLFGTGPPSRLRRPLVIQALSHRLQEKASRAAALPSRKVGSSRKPTHTYTPCRLAGGRATSDTTKTEVDASP
jgi:hypothetical protein